MNSRERMLRACRGEPVDRPPVWLMRQAGRYLPEYREIRAHTSFLELCADPAGAAEVSLHPYQRFGVDAIVVFSDILLPLTATKLELDFNPGPVIAEPLDPSRGLERLAGDVAPAMAATCEAIRRIRDETSGEAAIVGFSGAPWTLAAYALEARLSRDTLGVIALSYQHPDLCDALLERMAEISAATLTLQIEAGADVLQIFDTWAGLLSPARFRRFAGRALARVLELLPEERPPVILFARGAAHLVDELAALGPEVVSLDWRVDLGDAAQRIGSRVSLQGNLDPVALFQPPEAIEAQVRELVAQGRQARGHVVNLGHGILPQTPVEGVAAFVRTVLAG
jgi:uroporphyrinogen decarboxylase